MRIHSHLGVIRAVLLGSMGITLGAACGGESEGGNPPTTKLKHRPAATVCENQLGVKGDAQAPVPDAGPGSDECATDSDCPGQYDYCGSDGFGLGGSVRVCKTGCVQDGDCGAGQICNCEAPIGHCVSATCVTDASCGKNELCLEHRSVAICGGDDNVSFSCAVPGTQCGKNEDCGDLYTACIAGNCVPTGVCGRPFLVEGVARVAGVEERRDWALALAPDVGGLSREERDLLATHWAEVGCMEHASIAAFARFTLELLGLGAPAELVEASQAALGDETAHARIAFGLAGTYAGRPLGPSTLSLRGALDSSSNATEIIRHAFLEMCVGETLAAVEARAAALEATDSVVREALDRIARDELRHAELGYRFVKWALERLGPKPRRNVVDDLKRLLQDTLAERPTNGVGQGAPEHGLLAPDARALVRRDALRYVVQPCAEALFSETTLGAVAASDAVPLVGPA